METELPIIAFKKGRVGLIEEKAILNKLNKAMMDLPKE